MKKRLNIFIDESGDFGFAKGSSELYAVSFVLHESSNSIKNELTYLNEKLDSLNYNGMIHLAYLISKRGDYTKLSIEKRKAIFWAIFYFSIRVKARFKTIIIDKTYINRKNQLSIILNQEINKFVQNNKKYFNSFEKIVIYYDNGQETLGNILDKIFIGSSIEKRDNFNHKEKTLFQVSDMLTIIDKLDYKRKNNLEFTKAETFFFEGENFRHIINLLKGKRFN